MNETMIQAELQRMWKLRGRCIQEARALKTERKTEDHFSRIACIGFSYHAHQGKWSASHSEAVRAYMKDCSGLGHDADIKDYLALCYGALMGLFSAKHIDRQLFLYGMSRLPGLAFSKKGARP